MAMRKGGGYVEGAPKKTRQGRGMNTKYARLLAIKQRRIIVVKVNKTVT